jgi:hypothetical protein
MKYYTFSTEAEANTACPIILQASFDARCDGDTCLTHPIDPETGQPTCNCSCLSYMAGTTCPGEPVQRTTNTDYVVPWDRFAGDMGYTVVDIDPVVEWPEGY